MTLLELILAYLVLFIGGGGIAMLLVSRSPRLNPLELFCLAWLFGVGIISLLLWIGSMFSSGPLLQFIVTLTCGLIGAAGWQTWHSSGIRLEWPTRISKFEWFLAALLVIQVAMIFYASFKHTLGWDGLLVWEIKARYAFLNGGIMPSQYLSGADRVFSHPDYPLAVPLNQVWIYLWIGEPNQFWAKTIFPIFYAVGATLLVILGGRLTGSRHLGFLTAILLFFVPQVTIGTGGAMVGYADFPLAVFYLATIGYLLCGLRQRAPGAFGIFAACLTLLPWIKKEGVILWAVALVIGLAVIIIQGRPYRMCLAFLPGFALIIGWKTFRAAASGVGSLDFVPVSVSALRANADRIGSIGAAVFGELTTIEHWGIFWGVVAMAALCAVWNWRRLSTLLLLASICVPVAVYTFTYIFSAWPHYLDHVGSSISRLIMQLVPVAWLLIATSAGKRVVSPIREEVAAG